MSDRFLYFAFGSNLKSKRVKINSPSAEFVGWAVLDNFRLAFAGLSKRWHGASATIIPDTTDHVIGCVWSIEKSNLPELDRQEGVHQKIYEPIQLTVRLNDDSNVTCRSYRKLGVDDVIDGKAPIPEDLPSHAYLSVIIDGAIEHNFPEKYIAKLNGIKHNGIMDIPMMKNIEENRKEADEPEESKFKLKKRYFIIAASIFGIFAFWLKS